VRELRHCVMRDPNRYHYAVTYTRRKAYRMYVDGSLSATLVSAEDPLRKFVSGSPTRAHIGCQGGTINHLRGYFRDFRVYNRTLT
jgi:hypothetical protein